MDDVVIVGPCAAGKSTLARGLSEQGYHAHLIAQEHSGVRDLWRRHQARALVYLDVDLERVHQRGRPNFPAWLHQQQKDRLKEARDAAACYVNTAPLSIPDVLEQVLKFLAAANIRPNRQPAP
jgi:shikimate kinase